MMLYARSCERPSNNSASVFLPSSVSNSYSFSTGTQGSSSRFFLASSLSCACSASSFASSSRAACQSSRVAILCSGIPVFPLFDFRRLRVTGLDRGHPANSSPCRRQDLNLRPPGYELPRLCRPVPRRRRDDLEDEGEVDRGRTIDSYEPTRIPWTRPKISGK